MIRMITLLNKYATVWILCLFFFYFLFHIGKNNQDMDQGWLHVAHVECGIRPKVASWLGEGGAPIGSEMDGKAGWGLRREAAKVDGAGVK